MAALLGLNSSFGLILEEDVEFRLAPIDLHGLVYAISKHTSLHYSMLGGCWSQHLHEGPLGRGTLGKLVTRQLPGSGALIESPSGSNIGSRCAHAYVISDNGARRLLADAALHAPKHTIDLHFNSVHSRDASLSCAFVEPPVACQIRGGGRGKVCGAEERQQDWPVPLPDSEDQEPLEGGHESQRMNRAAICSEKRRYRGTSWESTSRLRGCCS